MQLRTTRYLLIVLAVTLLSAGGGLVSAKLYLKTRPTCINVIRHYFELLPEQERRLFDFGGDYGRESHVAACREGGWSMEMKTCFLAASSFEELDRCPIEWRNAGFFCREVATATDELHRRCGRKPAWTSGMGDCSTVKAINSFTLAPLRTCVLDLRDAHCSKLDNPIESCAGILVR